MKHKTFAKENEKKLKLIIKAQSEEIRRLEREIKDLKLELQSVGRTPKVKEPKQPKPDKETKPVSKQDIRVKPPMSDAERIEFCKNFSERFKKGLKSED